MELNDNKAGMEGLEKDKINAIIKEASKNSRYYKHQQQRETRIRERIEQQQKVLETFSEEKIRLSEMHIDRVVEQLESERDLSRTIVHVDMDAFYAAVEMRDDPSLRDKPMAVGGNSMLSTSNYIARKFGVRAAQPGFIGKKLCPDLIIVPCNFEKYTKCSEIIRDQMKYYDPNFAPMSLDEAYLDITEYLSERRRQKNLHIHKRVRYSGECSCRLPYDGSLSTDRSVASEGETPLDFEQIYQEPCSKCSKQRTVFVDIVNFGNSVEDVVKELRFKIEQATGLTASAGIAANAMLAKVCSDKNKPNGQFYLPPDKETIMNFVNCLPIRKVCGIGGVTESMLKALGVNTCRDIYEKRGIISLLFSKISTKFFLKVSLGLGSSMFEHRDSDRKSVSVERTFSEISNPKELHNVCLKLCEKLADCLDDEFVKGRTVTLKMKTIDFEVRTRAQSCDRPINSAQALYDIAKCILQDEIDSCAPNNLSLRLMGVRLSNLLAKNRPEQKTKADDCKEITEFFKPVTLAAAVCVNSNEDVTCNSYLPAVVELVDNKEAAADTSLDCIQLSDEDKRDDKDEEPLCIAVDESRDSTCSNDFACESKIAIPLSVCPVCNFKQRNITDLATFNTHVDRCLSLRAIGEINNDEKERNLLNNGCVVVGKKDGVVVTVKRKSDTTNSLASSPSKNKRTLLDYFPKK